jgi:hypothetical protein
MECGPEYGVCEYGVDSCQSSDAAYISAEMLRTVMLSLDVDARSQTLHGVNCPG